MPLYLLLLMSAWLSLYLVCTYVLSQFSPISLFVTRWTDCSPPGSSVHEILQTRILEWVSTPSSMVSSPPRNQTRISRGFCTAGVSFVTESLRKPLMLGTLTLNYYSLYDGTSRIWFYALLGRLVNQKMWGPLTIYISKKPILNIEN